MGARFRNLFGRGCFIPFALLVGCTETLANNGSPSDASPPPDATDVTPVDDAPSTDAPSTDVADVTRDVNASPDDALDVTQGVDAPSLDVTDAAPTPPDVADVPPPGDAPLPLDDAGCWTGGLTIHVGGRPLLHVTAFAASRQRYALLASNDQGSYLVLLNERAQVVGTRQPMGDVSGVVSFEDGFGLIDATGIQPVDLTGAPVGARLSATLVPHTVERIGDTVVGLRPIPTDAGPYQYALVQMPAHGRGPVTETGLVAPAGWTLSGVGVSRMLLRRSVAGATRMTQFAVMTASGLATLPSAEGEVYSVSDALWIPERDEWVMVGANQRPTGMLYDYALQHWNLSATGMLSAGGLGDDHGNVRNGLLRGGGGSYALFSVQTVAERLTVLRPPDGSPLTQSSVNWRTFHGAWSAEMNRYVVAYEPYLRVDTGPAELRCFAPR